MKMKKIILIVIMTGAFSSLFAGLAIADTDYKCVNDCTRNGYNYGYCLNQCSFYGPGDKAKELMKQGPFQPHSLKQWPTPSPSVPSVDYKCMRGCEAKGYLYNYCEQSCSY